MHDRTIINDVAMLSPAQAIIVTGYTGVMLCDLDDFLVDLNARAKPEKPYTKADLHMQTFEDVIKPLYAADCQAIIPVDWEKESRREQQAEQDELRAAAAQQRRGLILP